MSRIDELLAELCPDGVRHEPLADIGKWYGGGTPSKSRLDYWKNGTIPWVSPKDMGRPIVETTEDYITAAAVNGSATKLVPENSVAVVVRSSILDRILPIALIPVPVALNQDMKAVAARDGVMPSYIAHLLQSRGPAILQFARRAGGSVASIESNKLFSFRVPVPPLEIQIEIVKVLDSFTEFEAQLEAELGAELEARRRQYQYYRDALLAFSDQDIRWAAMAEVGEFFRGRRFTKADYVEDGVPCIHYGDIYTQYGTATGTTTSHVDADLAPTLRFAQPGDLIIAGVGETVEDVGKAVAWLGSCEVAIHDDCFAFRHSLNPRFVSYYFQSTAFHAEKNKFVARAKVKRLSAESLAKLTIPVPSPDEQARIVAILDKFDALVNDIAVGLPAEIAARRRQYAYYRDRLLTFKEAV